MKNPQFKVFAFFMKAALLVLPYFSQNLRTVTTTNPAAVPLSTAINFTAAKGVLSVTGAVNAFYTANLTILTVLAKLGSVINWDDSIKVLIDTESNYSSPVLYDNTKYQKDDSIINGQTTAPLIATANENYKTLAVNGATSCERTSDATIVADT